MNRKLLFIGIGAFLLAGLVILSRGQLPKTKPPQYITPGTIHPSSLPKPLTSSPVLYTGEPVFSFPTEIPFYEITARRNFETESARLFALNNIAGKPTLIAGSRGKYIIASQQEKEGTISETPLSFAFTLGRSSGSIISNDMSMYKKASDDLFESWSILSSTYKTRLLGIKFFSFSNDAHPIEIPTPAGATLAQLDFGVLLDTLPVLIGDADTPIFTTSFDGNNTIIRVQGIILPNIENKGVIKIIPYVEALQKLKTNKGVLSGVSYTNRGIERFLTGESPTNAAIEKAELGYLYSVNQDYLIPIYVFTGRSTLSGEEIITVTIVSAI